MKIFFYGLRENDEEPHIEHFSREYGYEVGSTLAHPNKDNIVLAKGSEAIVSSVCDMNAEYIDLFRAVGVKYLLSRSIGYNHIDIAHANQVGLHVCHNHYPPETVANYAIMLMLMCCRNMGQILRGVSEHNFNLKGKKGRDLSSCTVGIIGTGHIASTVLKHLRGFGCRLLACGGHLSDECGEFTQSVDLDTLLRESDIISIHTSATPENYHLIDAEAIARMKDDAILINTARGDLVDTDALIHGLSSGKISGAGLDVLENEYAVFPRSGRGKNKATVRTVADLPKCDHQSAFGLLHG